MRTDALIHLQFPPASDHSYESQVAIAYKRVTVKLTQAVLCLQMRSAVQTVAGLFPTSIISGRGREKVEGFVQLKELFYAGSHGMDIVGPQV